VNLDIALQGPGGADRVRGKVVLVLIDRQVDRAIPIPDEVRERIASFHVTGQGQKLQKDAKE
jgi:hypothetical protein